MGTIPQEIIQKIKDYIPRDKDMKSPTADHIKSLLRDYIFLKPKIFIHMVFIYHFVMNHSANIH